jgi:enoyl-CoA hydratase/carnithine racemase
VSDLRIDTNRDGTVAIVRLALGPDGCLKHADGQLLAASLAELNHDASCRSIVLAGGRDGFCAGGDFAPGFAAGDDIAMRGRLRLAANLYRDLRGSPKPVIAAVEGAARGSGLGLVAACDYVVAAEDASFACGTNGAGLLPDSGLLWSLPEKIGDAKARELMMLGLTLSADDARRYGLVSEMVAPGAALEQALALARSFESLPFVTVALLKAALYYGGMSIEDGCRLELDLNPLARQAVDHLEAVTAFMEKRKPNFVGN